MSGTFSNKKIKELKGGIKWEKEDLIIELINNSQVNAYTAPED